MDRILHVLQVLNHQQPTQFTMVNKRFEQKLIRMVICGSKYFHQPCFTISKLLFFSIIENIISSQEHHSHSFTTQCQNLIDNNGIYEKTSFAKIKCCAEFEDMKAYISFLQKCSTLDQYIIIWPTGNGNNCFECGVIDTAVSPEKTLENYQFIFTIIPDDADTQDVTLIIHEYIVQFPDHDYSRTYRDCLDRNFIDILTLSELLDVTETQTLHRLIKNFC